MMRAYRHWPALAKH